MPVLKHSVLVCLPWIYIMCKVQIFFMTTDESWFRGYCCCKYGLMEGLMFVVAVCETANKLLESPRLHLMKA